jgi:hypothetical protein
MHGQENIKKENVVTSREPSVSACLPPQFQRLNQMADFH